ncbi:MAG TPA: trypsin-like peptidase domain-containing protein [Gaiellaceae bacterium]
MPGLTRRLLLAVLATLASAVAASPAGASGHTQQTGVKPGPNTGIVDIYTTLGFEDGVAAGTGMIISRSGQVLTNNHVISGATHFRVVNVSTHRRYKATVVGYSVSRDIAVLQLANASNLRRIKLDRSFPLKVGLPVVARGNAEGRGGVPKTARGQIIALHQQIVAKDESGDSETLNDTIATDAPVVPGYSGGPLEDARGRAIGIVTAGSTSGPHRGFAIPIKQALQLAHRITTGKSNSVVHVGPTAFLGVRLANASDEAKIQSVVTGQAADQAGLAAGDVITSLNGKPISSVTELRQVVLTLVPGKAVPIGWTDTNDVAQTSTITPMSGPPQ